MLFTGRKAHIVVRHFVSPVRRKVPVAEVGPVRAGETDSLTRLMERVAGEDGALGRRVPWSFLPPPRFPLAQFVLWALTKADAENQRLDQPLRAWLRRDGFAWQRPLDKAEYITRFLAVPALATGSVSAVITNVYDMAVWGAGVIWGVALLFAVSLATLSAANWSTGHFRYRWFGSQPFLPREPRESLADYVARIHALKDADPDGDEVAKLLVNAFHEDLRIAYRRLRPWLLWPGWARGAHAVLVLTDTGPGTAGRRLLTLMHDVQVQVGRPVPLLVVAAMDAPPDFDAHRHAGATMTDAAGLNEVYARWRSGAERPAPCPYVVIDVGDTEPEGGDSSHRVGRRGLALTYRAAVVMAVVLPLYVTARALLPPVCAAGLTLEDEQCVGVTASVESFSPALAPLLKRIDQQNKAIHPDAKSFTVVYFGTLTQRPGTTDVSPLVGTAGELIGIAARQARYNALGELPRMRVEFANAGQSYAHAAAVAEQLKRRAVGDETLAAAIGLGWSREEIRNAVGVLGSAQLPMVSTTATADNVADVEGKPSAWFFRLPAANSRQARATVEWITKLGVPTTRGRRFKGEQVAVLTQAAPHELYSKDLTGWFIRLLPGVSEYEFSDDSKLTQRVREACDRGTELIYFSGRGAQLATLADAWRGHCAARDVAVMAGDDVTREVARSLQNGGSEQSLALQLVSLTDPRRQPDVPEGEKRSQSSGHRAVINEWVTKAAADKVALPSYSAGHAALGYDAALVVTEALGAFLGMGDFLDIWGDTHVRTGIHYNLRGLSVVGATGKITFAAESEGHDALDRQVWLVSAGEKAFKVHYICTPTDEKAACARPK
ncbi:hypothetical protein DP939_04950 [Spongiactinospora rosea]|uniref:ABC-type branched-subunit amino acid transport system substrate-binding protein n=1 Tax=Spongiactinospora rosea TaxID=2248750 RepID=A0A366M773_9ACTN|nr:ABC transporter substrate-binding protein [Spongiactinospora rosea]RBQ22015.1 hypothetical protein DP939_04950 [Spongiactinospora rosea]